MKEDTRQDYAERIIRVLVHIQQNLDDDLPLEKLARLAFFSPFHFHRVFRGMVGESVKSHIRRLRLERAAMRLKQSEMAVTAIAFEAGYETHESFTRAFRTLLCDGDDVLRCRPHGAVRGDRARPGRSGHSGGGPASDSPQHRPHTSQTPTPSLISD